MVVNYKQNISKKKKSLKFKNPSLGNVLLGSYDEHNHRKLFFADFKDAFQSQNLKASR